MSTGAAVATFAPAAPHEIPHASGPVGHTPWTQSCAAPGLPWSPTHVHSQHPQSDACAQACPGGVEPGPGPPAVSEHPEGAARRKAIARTGPVRTRARYSNGARMGSAARQTGPDD